MIVKLEFVERFTTKATVKFFYDGICQTKVLFLNRKIEVRSDSPNIVFEGQEKESSESESAESSKVNTTNSTKPPTIPTTSSKPTSEESKASLLQRQYLYIQVSFVLSLLLVYMLDCFRTSPNRISILKDHIINLSIIIFIRWSSVQKRCAKKSTMANFI